MQFVLRVHKVSRLRRPSPTNMNQYRPQPMATAAVAAAAAPSLLTQVGMAGSAAVITVTFIHPIDVVKVRRRGSLPNAFVCLSR